MNTLKNLLRVLVVFGATLLTACGGGSGGSGFGSSGLPAGGGGSGAESGTVQLILTDAEEDFLTYRVRVNNITLTSLSGTEVDLLSTPTEVDFVQYQELSELFAVRSVPVGTYDSIILELDYSDAEIVIQDELGNPATAAVMDADGNDIDLLTVEMQFGGAQAVRVTPARVASLTLDLDLAASNEIVSFDPAEVVVEPFLMATVDLDRQREHRIRGLLQSVDTLDQSFVLDLIPMRRRDGNFGEVTLNTDFDTLYDIDGIEYEGNSGLEALAALDVNAPVVAFGGYDSDQEGPLVSRVVAGTSLPWDDRDVVKGIVTARSGNTLTIAGAVIELRSGRAYFGRNISVIVSDDTTVTGYRLGDADIQNLSVGQNILALGSFADDGTDFGGTLNVEVGQVRMQLTSLVGRVETAMPLTLNVRGINRRPIEIFDFSGTGISESFDADPENYEVYTGSLNISNLEVEEWIVARGYLAEFGMAPEDFEAVSITDPEADSPAAGLIAVWEDEAAETLVLDGTDIELNMEEGRLALRLAPLPGDLEPEYELSHVTGEAEGRYAIQVRGEGIRIYSAYSDFVATLKTQLDMGEEARKMTARGEFDLESTVMTAITILVTF